MSINVLMCFFNFKGIILRFIIKSTYITIDLILIFTYHEYNFGRNALHVGVLCG